MSGHTMESLFWDGHTIAAASTDIAVMVPSAAFNIKELLITVGSAQPPSPFLSVLFLLLVLKAHPSDF